MDREELILGCDCMCVDHVARFNYFPIKEGEDVDKENDVIFMNVNANNLYCDINPFYFWGFDFGHYFRFNFLKRFYYAFQHIINSKKLAANWLEGVLNSFDFQNKDLDKLYDYFSLLAKNEEDVIHAGHRKEDFSRHFDICFYAEREYKDLPFVLGYSVVFRRGNLWKRIKTAFSYIFGTHNKELGVSLNEHDAEVLKAYIACIKRKNAIEKEINN